RPRSELTAFSWCRRLASSGTRHARRRARDIAASSSNQPTPDAPFPAADVLQPESDEGGGNGTHDLLGTSHVVPSAQSCDVVHVVRHAPNAVSQMYGAQSNATASAMGHAAPAAGQNAGPMPLVASVHRLRPHSVFGPAPVHRPPPLHVPTQVP